MATSATSSRIAVPTEVHVRELRESKGVRQLEDSLKRLSRDEIWGAIGYLEDDQFSLAKPFFDEELEKQALGSPRLEAKLALCSSDQKIRSRIAQLDHMKPFLEHEKHLRENLIPNILTAKSMEDLEVLIFKIRESEKVNEAHQNFILQDRLFEDLYEEYKKDGVGKGTRKNILLFSYSFVSRMPPNEIIPCYEKINQIVFLASKEGKFTHLLEPLKKIVTAELNRFYAEEIHAKVDDKRNIPFGVLWFTTPEVYRELDKMDYTPFWQSQNYDLQVATSPIIFNSSKKSSAFIQAFAEDLKTEQMALFKRIGIQEFSKQSWSKNIELSRHVNEAITYENKIAQFVIQQVLMCEHKKDQREMLEFFIRLMKGSFDLKDYNTAYAIYLGLNHTVLTRLKVLEKPYRKLHKILDDVRLYFAPEENYKNLRALTIENDILPCLFLVLRDLTLIGEGNPNLNFRHLNLSKFDLIVKAQRRFYNMQMAIPESGVLVTNLVNLILETDLTRDAHALSLARQPAKK